MIHKTEHSYRWTGAVDESKIAPRGPERALNQAVELLGPFKFETEAEAEDRGGLSREFARKRVVVLARDYNKHSHQHVNAPRVKDVLQALEKLESMAGELARFLDSLDDMTRFYLRTGATGNTYFSSRAWIKDAEYERLPHPEAGRIEGDWASKLDGLSRYASFCSTGFLKLKGISSIDGADRGGNTNLLKQGAGSAEWELVSAGWYVFNIFKRGEAVGTEGGLFHLFLMDVFEFSTGKNPEELKLLPLIKKIVVERRIFLEMEDREIVLQRELEGLEEEDRSNHDEARADEIRLELARLHRQRIELAPLLSFPGTRKRQGKEPHSDQ